MSGYPLFEIGDAVDKVGGGARGSVIEHIDGQGGLTEYVVQYPGGETETFPEYALEFADPVGYDEEEPDYEWSDDWYDDDYEDSWSDYDSE